MTCRGLTNLPNETIIAIMEFLGLVRGKGDVSHDSHYHSSACREFAEALLMGPTRLRDLGILGLYNCIHVDTLEKLEDLLATLERDPERCSFIRVLMVEFNFFEEFDEDPSLWPQVRIPVLPNCRYMSLDSANATPPMVEFLRWAENCPRLERLDIEQVSTLFSGQDAVLLDPDTVQTPEALGIHLPNTLHTMLAGHFLLDDDLREPFWTLCRPWVKHLVFSPAAGFTPNAKDLDGVDILDGCATELELLRFALPPSTTRVGSPRSHFDSPTSRF